MDRYSFFDSNKHTYEGAYNAPEGTVRPGLLGGVTVSWHRRTFCPVLGWHWHKFAECAVPDGIRHTDPVLVEAS